MAKETFITAFGKAFYPHLDKPDTAFGAEKYNTGLVLDEAGFSSFKKALEAFVADNWKKKTKPKLPVKKLDDDAGYLIRASSQYKPNIVDSKNRKLPEGIIIGGGSTMRLGVAFNAYDNGINLYLNGVQVKELVEYEGGSPFEEIDDGYEADTTGFEEDAGDDVSTGGASALDI